MADSWENVERQKLQTIVGCKGDKDKGWAGVSQA
ncbi:hypothetical protein HK44_008250 [Pseudomonas fluorescens HK44]|uniref:Uncharacterized protein n=1 Tax=Pseudomonas fluorescens HK44 TaxID=1042209 RepID=A0A010ST45_PSEFL|nr:hypothetical protein HK44_008250 [Pseudomonas fluorescens HK44]